MTFWRSYAPSRADAASHIPSPSRIAGLVAILPIAVLALLFWWRPLIAPEAVLVTASLGYGTALLALTNGMRWGLTRLPSIGSAIAVAALASLLVPVELGLVLLLALFFLNAFIHVTAVERGQLPYWFGSLTSLLTAGATVALIAILVRLLL